MKSARTLLQPRTGVVSALFAFFLWTFLCATSCYAQVQNKVIHTVRVKPIPSCAVCTPDGKFMYVAGLTHTSRPPTHISKIDTTTYAVNSTLAVGALGIDCLAISPDGQTLYAGGNESSFIFVISTATDSVTAKIPVSAFGMAITPDGKQVWAGTFNGISVIDTSNNQVGANSIPLTLVNYFSFTPSGTFVYASYAVNGVFHLALIDTATQAVINSQVADGPLHANGFKGPDLLTMSPDGASLYLREADAGKNAIKVLNTTNDTVKGIYSLSLPYILSAMNITPNGNYLYVGRWHNNTAVSLIDTVDPVTGLVIGSPTAVGNVPLVILFLPGGKYAGIVNEGSGTVNFMQITPPQ